MKRGRLSRQTKTPVNSLSPTKPATLNRSSPSISRIQGRIREIDVLENAVAKGQRKLVLDLIDPILRGIESVFHGGKYTGIP
jgi:hypothetical protein